MTQESKTRGGKYPMHITAALTAISAFIGPTLPPSIPIVLYARGSDTPLGYVFMFGVLTGLLVRAVQMTLIYVMAMRRGFAT